jgi:hypothetical protein
VPTLRREANEIAEHDHACRGGGTGARAALELAHLTATIASFAAIAVSVIGPLAPGADLRHLVLRGRHRTIRSREERRPLTVSWRTQGLGWNQISDRRSPFIAARAT